MIQNSEYGSLGPIVKAVGSIVSAGIAVSWSWRRRTNWEPSEQDVPNGPNRVGGLITALSVIILFTQYSALEHTPVLLNVLWIAGLACVFFLLAYGFLVGMNTYYREIPGSKGSVERVRVIGGFSLREAAIAKLKDPEKTIQKIFKDAGYDTDMIWTRPSRELAKTLFVVSYLGLTVGGSIALTSAAILYLLKRH